MSDHVFEVEFGEQTAYGRVSGFKHLESSDVSRRRVVQYGEIKTREHEVKICSHQADFFRLPKYQFQNN